MRIGGLVYNEWIEPQQWVAAVISKGYRAAYCPVDAQAEPVLVRNLADFAQQADIVIAEVGAWSNPLSPDLPERSKALRHCQQQLALADEIGARCRVNIAGSLGLRWDGPHPENLTQATFDLIVDIVREIIDAVKPRRTFYTLEPMPWMYPDSPDNYLQLLRAIDRRQFAVHLDPVNMICSPQRYFGNAAFLRECFAKLGPYIKSCHAKDILLRDQLTTHLDEVRPGLGYLDYRVFLREMQRLPDDTPLTVARPLATPAARESSYHRSRYRDATTALGGPAVRDSVWFFVGHQYLRDYDSQPGADPAFPRTYEQNKTFAKLTWRLAPAWQLGQSVHHERWVNPDPPTLATPFEVTLPALDTEDLLFRDAADVAAWFEETGEGEWSRDLVRLFGVAIEARHGKPVGTQDAGEFEGRSWYRPDPAFSEDRVASKWTECSISAYSRSRSRI